MRTYQNENWHDHQRKEGYPSQQKSQNSPYYQSKTHREHDSYEVSQGYRQQRYPVQDGGKKVTQQRVKQFDNHDRDTHQEDRGEQDAYWNPRY